MSLPGGPSDKAGNRYEQLWAALVLTDLLLGKAESVRFEVPGPDGVGFEFRVTGAVVSWHQSKRQRSGSEWSVAALASEGVLGPWWPKVRAGERCAFVSRTGAREMRELVERARDAVLWDEFAVEFLTGQAAHAFTRLRSAWNDPPGEQVFEALRRLVEVHLIDEDNLRGRVVDRLAALVSGDPESALAVLEQLIQDSVHRERTAAQVWGRLQERGFRPRGLSDDESVRRAVESTVEAFVARHPRLPNGERIPRAEAAAITGHLEAGARVVVTGGAGYGKSMVLEQAVERAAELGWPVLALSADVAGATVTGARSWGEALELPYSPVTVLAGMASGRPALLVLDQLDAVGTVSGRYAERREAVEQLLRQADSHPEIRVVLACRSFDLDNDAFLQSLSEREDTTRVDVGPLDQDVVA